MQNITVSQIFMIIGLMIVTCLFLVVDAPKTHSITSGIVIIENNKTWTVKSSEPISPEMIPREIAMEITHIDRIGECELILHPKRGVEFNVEKWNELKVHSGQSFSTVYSGY